MTIQMDTREHQGKKDHILDYFARNGISVEPSKCWVGDWTLLLDHSICVDTKTLGLQEVYKNVIGTDHARFHDECVRAKKRGILLVILIEEETITDIEQVPEWINYRREKWFEINEQHERGVNLRTKQSAKPPATSETLYKSMRTMQERYGVQWEFTTKAECGARIVEILGGGSEQQRS